jgi:hypothetical protein
MRRFSLMLLLLAASCFGATATPVTISTTSVVGSTVTINATAHGLTANQGFCVSGSSVSNNNICSTVATVPNGNSFTFTLAGATACASSCGTSVAAKQVIVLSILSPNGFEIQVNYLLWLTSNQGISGSASSNWSGANTAEKNAIAAGTTIEIARSKTFANTATKTEIQAQLQKDFATQQAALAATVQPGQFFGMFMDSAGWSQ